MFEGKTEIILGKNPHHCNTKTETGKKTNRLFPSSSSEDDFESTSSEESFDLKGNGKTAQRPRTGHNQDKGKSRDSGSQAQRREIEKKENQSPNSNNFSPPQNVSSQGTGHSIQGYMPPSTSATAPSLGKTWDNSLQSQTVRQTGQPAYRPPTHPLPPTSFSPPFGAKRWWKTGDGFF